MKMVTYILSPTVRDIEEYWLMGDASFNALIRGKPPNLGSQDDTKKLKTSLHRTAHKVFRYLKPFMA